jgi:DNA-binding MarR family transcriptional regulator
MARSDFLDLDCLAYATRRTGRAVTNYFNARMAGLDLTVSQFGLLAAVASMPGATLAAIGEAMLIDESTLVRNFAVMERRGLIAAEGGRGRGGKHLTLTRAGLQLHVEAVAIWRATNRRLAMELGADEAAAGRTFLRALGVAAERLKQQPGKEAAADKPARRRIRAKA